MKPWHQRDVGLFSAMENMTSLPRLEDAWEQLESADVDWYTVAQFTSIPIIASLIGYGTNLLAIQMCAATKKKPSE